MWSQLGEKWSNSVLQLKTTKARYHPARPYASPRDKLVSGSGFIVDIEKGFIVTNAHVVENPISISGRLPRTGKRDLSIELIGICREKDLALCKMHHDDIKLIIRGLDKSQICALNMRFGDSMSVKPGDEVLTIGYPLGQENIKYTTGVISGFEALDKKENMISEREDVMERSPTYIQITAPLNCGQSGGPLLNRSGEVIGVNAAGYLFAQNIGYAIPSRTFLAIYPELLRSTIVKMPNLALDWNKTNREIMQRQTGSPYTYGIYVRKVHPDSVFDQLERGDIIKRIDYHDYFWGKDGKTNGTSFSLSDCEKNGDKREKVLVTILLDRFGLSYRIGKLENPVEYKDDKIKFEHKFTERKINLAEIMDMIPIGTELSLNLCRNGDWYTCKTSYNHVPSDRVVRKYPKLEPVDYEIFAGLACVNLYRKHVDVFENLDNYLENDENRYTKRVIIVQVFPGTSAYKTQVLKPGHLIKSVLGFDEKGELIKDSHRVIKTLDDIRHILRLRPDQIQITTTDDDLFLIKTSTIIPEDKEAMKNFNIQHSYLLE